MHDYLVELGSARSMDEFLPAALTGIVRLIPTEHSVFLLDTRIRCLSILKEGPLAVMTGRDLESYNGYYHKTIPMELMSFKGDKDFVDWGDFHNSEFVCDFARPIGLRYGVSAMRLQWRASLCVQRGFGDKAFSSRERDIIEFLNPHINNYIAIFEKLEALSSRAPTADTIRDRFPRLSRREAEIAYLLGMGLTAAEMGSRLFISRRTAEAHIEHLYTKLGVRSKREALEALTVAGDGAIDGIDPLFLEDRPGRRGPCPSPRSSARFASWTRVSPQSSAPSSFSAS